MNTETDTTNAANMHGAHNRADAAGTNANLSDEERERREDSRADALAICALLAIAMTTVMYFLTGQ